MHAERVRLIVRGEVGNIRTCVNMVNSAVGRVEQLVLFSHYFHPSNSNDCCEMCKETTRFRFILPLPITQLPRQKRDMQRRQPVQDVVTLGVSERLR